MDDYAAGQDTSSPSGYLIPAAGSLHERRPRTLKHGDTFGVFDGNGDALAAAESPEGLFHLDTRYLSQYFLSINSARPILLSSAMRDDNGMLTCDLSNPDLFTPDGEPLVAHDLLHIRRSRYIWQSSCRERIAVRNFDLTRRRVRLALSFASDFSDLFEVRGARRPRRGHFHKPQVTRDAVVLSYMGLDALLRQTTLRFDPPPQKLDHELAIFDLDLEAGQQIAVFVEISCNAPSAGASTRRSFFEGLRDSARRRHRILGRTAALHSNNEMFNETIQRSVSDLYMLVTDTPEGPYPYAGIPWFSTAFGRDALITALEMLWLYPGLARGVLAHLAANQAKEFDPVNDAEPGKILHEIRRGEMAELREVPFRRYYGSIDSTPLFVFLAGEYLERTGDRDFIASIWPNILDALAWIEKYGDRDGDGFVEYARRNPDGLVNQGWKDSHDSVSHEDGTLAQGPIALAEVQAYVYGAWKAAVAMTAALNIPDLAEQYEARAIILKAAFDKAFFDEQLGTYVLALDGDKQPCRVRSSNAGHALLTGLATSERAETVVRTLMHRDSHSGWGIRTLSADARRYNPMSYHNGSVWPHDNALITMGFGKYGYRAEAARMLDGLYSTANHMDLQRLPELFCGFGRQPYRGPTLYPVACSPQAWAAAAPMAMLQACLGLHFDTQAQRITFTCPTLPAFLEELTLHGLRVGSASADVQLKRHGTEVVVSVLRRSGKVSVTTNC